nr:MAG TPA: hypothetical protein [Caudoviricetes sp.]
MSKLKLNEVQQTSLWQSFKDSLTLLRIFLINLSDQLKRRKSSRLMLSSES